MATTLTLTIGGANYLPQYKTNSVEIREQLNNQGNSMTLLLTRKSGQSAPQVGSEIILKDGSRTLFGGFVTKAEPVEYGVGEFQVYNVEASDYTYVLVNKNAQASYEAQTLKAIVDDLVATNVDSGYGITTTNVDTGPTIDTINFNHITLRKAFENLAKLSGYVWWVDYNKDIHFVPQTAAPSAPESFKDSAPGNHEKLTIAYDVSQVRNEITVLGGTQESSSYAQTILGDANAREWVLLYPVSAMATIELDTGAGYVSKTFGVDPKDDETSYYFMYSPDRGAIRCSSGSATPGATHKIRVTYTYPLKVSTKVRSATSVVLMKAIEGGDGIHAYTINDPTIVSNGQAQQRGLKELQQFENPTLTGHVTTRTGLLTAGSYFKPGQLVTVNSPAYQITTDTQYLIQKVKTTLKQNDDSIEYAYDIEFGGRYLGVLDFLQSIADVETPLDISGEVIKIQAVADIVTITESIGRDQHLNSVAESVTVSESIAKTNITPPFKYAAYAGANKAVWGKAEWK